MTTIIVVGIIILNTAVVLLIGRAAHYGNPSYEKPMVRRRHRRWLQVACHE